MISRSSNPVGPSSKKTNEFKMCVSAQHCFITFMPLINRQKIISITRTIQFMCHLFCEVVSIRIFSTFFRYFFFLLQVFQINIQFSLFFPSNVVSIYPFAVLIYVRAYVCVDSHMVCSAYFLISTKFEYTMCE